MIRWVGLPTKRVVHETMHNKVSMIVINSDSNITRQGQLNWTNTASIWFDAVQQ